MKEFIVLIRPVEHLLVERTKTYLVDNLGHEPSVIRKYTRNELLPFHEVVVDSQHSLIDTNEPSTEAAI